MATVTMPVVKGSDTMQPMRHRPCPQFSGRNRAAALLLAGLTVLPLSLTVAGSPAQAQQMQVQRIAAVVNDDAITVRDLEDRMDLLLSASSLPDNPDTRRRLMPRVLQILVEERLKLQEAKRRNITVSDADLDSARQQIESNNRMAPGSLAANMRQKGVNPDTLDKQLRADVAWLKVVQSGLRRQISVEQEEIEAVLSTLRENLGKPQRLLAEIVLPFNDAGEEQQARALAERLGEQMKQGAAFTALARQFSSAPTAAVGGDLGWVPKGELDPELEEAVNALRPGTVSSPVVSGSSLHIILLRDVRETKKLDPAVTPVQISQLFFPARGAAAMPTESRDDIIATAAETAKRCDDINKLSDQLRLPNSGDIGTVKPADLPPAVGTVVAELKENTLSTAIDLPSGTVVVMVCARKDADGLPSREEIERRLENEKLDRLAQRTLRDLRRKALIDIRI
ncbi:peptidylprolyl isomerase [Novispirillum itersonii]|uniref:Parvulin-like PPIase n=1 Tax=Novispirillum itersonii TaxID=189 RepID=A0A7W9ZE54_NOVIT|nr:peptidylprolyl isomerase [Novispirillum itersonii]MBB6209488.1 peptidyl-prolyl cis-trans isomerase SurA [Novispirillum itersonii]